MCGGMLKIFDFEKEIQCGKALTDECKLLAGDEPDAAAVLP